MGNKNQRAMGHCPLILIDSPDRAEGGHSITSEEGVKGNNVPPQEGPDRGK